MFTLQSASFDYKIGLYQNIPTLYIQTGAISLFSNLTKSPVMVYNEIQPWDILRRLQA